MNNSAQYTLKQKIAAWLVHAFTASGIVAGFWAIVCISEGNFFMAFMMLFLTLVIDGIDGTFARMAKTTEVLPNMSGKTMDYVIDFATYAIIPAYLIYAATQNGTPVAEGGSYLVPDNLRFISAAIILLVSTLYYGREGMVSNDYYFVGFPVMWNMVAFYLYYVYQFSPVMNFVMIILFAVLHFVPIKFLYPSRTPRFKGMNIFITILFIVSNVALIVLVETGQTLPFWRAILRGLSLFTMLYFGAMAVYNTWFDPMTKEK
jgi:phosphatidylcholine synthase